MNAVRFHVVVGQERILPLPEGVHLQPGPAEVIILQPRERTNEAGPSGGASLSERLARRAQALNIRGLPVDLAQNHDYYLHGLPKGIDDQ